MEHLDLFSGIGGSSYALDNVFGKDTFNHTFCEIDPFCQAVLKKHWPHAQIHGDIRTFTSDAASKRCRETREHSKRSPQRPTRESGIFILTGGFPCQPFSQAGRRKGTADDRYLWPEMFRVIREFRPRWIVGENVGGFVTWNEGMVLEQVCADLEAEGYEVRPFIIPAVAVNAPHRRDRVWIVANRRSARRRENTGSASRDEGTHERRAAQNNHFPRSEGSNTSSHAKSDGRNDGTSENDGTPPSQEHSSRNATGIRKHASHSESKRRAEGRAELSRRYGIASLVGEDSASPNTRCHDNETGPWKKVRSQSKEPVGPITRFTHGAWSESWLTAATRLCVVDDGLPGGLARPRGWRNAALKGAGNAWVPQVAEQIFEAIKTIEHL
jgi:DNA (cytosine-5)-methyltransferase 1